MCQPFNISYIANNYSLYVFTPLNIITTLMYICLLFTFLNYSLSVHVTTIMKPHGFIICIILDTWDFLASDSNSQI